MGGEGPAHRGVVGAHAHAGEMRRQRQGDQAVDAFPHQPGDGFFDKRRRVAHADPNVERVAEGDPGQPGRQGLGLPERDLQKGGTPADALVARPQLLHLARQRRV